MSLEGECLLFLSFFLQSAVWERQDVTDNRTDVWMCMDITEMKRFTCGHVNEGISNTSVYIYLYSGYTIKGEGKMKSNIFSSPASIGVS